MSDVADAVVIGAGHNGLVAANMLADAGWDVVVLEATPHVGGAVRSAEVTAPGFTSDLCSAFYPLSAGSPALRGAGPGGVRAGVDPRPRRAGPPAARRPGRGAQPRPRRHRRVPGRVRAGRRRPVAARVRGVAADLRRAARRAAHAVPAGPGRGPAGRTGFAPAACCGWPGGSCCRCGRWATRCSPARAPRCCSPGWRCTPTWRRTRRPAARSAGCWPCWASSTGSRCRSAGPSGITDALVRPAGRPGRAGAHRGAGGAGRGRRPARRSACCAPTGGATGPAARSWPTCRRRRCTGTWSAPVTCRPGCWSDLRGVPVGRRHGQGRLGAVGAGRRGRAPVAGAGTVHLGGDVDGLARYAADLAARPGADRPVPARRADDHGRPDPVTGRHRVDVGLHPPAARRPRSTDEDSTRTSSGSRRSWRSTRPASGDCSSWAGTWPDRATLEAEEPRPGRRGDQRRHRRGVPAAVPPSGPRPGPGRHAGRPALPGRFERPPGRRRARGAGANAARAALARHRPVARRRLRRRRPGRPPGDLPLRRATAGGRSAAAAPRGRGGRRGRLGRGLPAPWSRRPARSARRRSASRLR